jgi:hypothetical protein
MERGANIVQDVGLAEVAGWYTTQTGLTLNDRHLPRVIRIQGYMQRNGLALGDLELQVNADRAWNRRRNRTPREQEAELIGSVGEVGGPLSYYWLLRRPTEGEEEGKPHDRGKARKPRGKRKGGKRGAAKPARGKPKPAKAAARPRRKATDPGEG